MNLKRMRIILKGHVQGVGLRPSLFRYARQVGVSGWVSNSSGGAVIEVEGSEEKLKTFSGSLADHLPKNSSFNDLKIEYIPLKGEKDFTILESLQSGEKSISVPPDMALCSDCKKEILNPFDRRYRYPFNNCTSCGPRFTILKSIPYDRENTTMLKFEMCPECRREYSDPLDRRFHAEPIACPKCGPGVTLVEKGESKFHGDSAVKRAVELLSSGRIVAVKSLGGFHLACAATDRDAVARLRARKERPHKPFAVMARDVQTLLKFCRPTDEEISLLESAIAPVVLVYSGKKQLLDIVSPGLNRIGVMLPYTPLHSLLFQSSLEMLLMTSGNRRDEPICKDSGEALQEFHGIADAFLLHNRSIENRADDSVMFAAGGKSYLVRRSRGFVPAPLLLNLSSKNGAILGVGAELKNSFSILKGDEAYLSPYIGDLSDSYTLSFFEESLQKFESLLAVKAGVIAHDLHPDYLSTQWAKDHGGAQLLPVQHHHAHIAGVMAEHRIEGPVIGVAYDGLGLGEDRTIWGGEFLIVEGAQFKRAAHLKPFPLVGSDRAAYEIWRSAYGLLFENLGKESADKILPDSFKKGGDLEKILKDREFSPLCTSMGRLFDAVAFILGLRDGVTYEGQAAMELESIAGENLEKIEGAYRFEIIEKDNKFLLDPTPLLVSIVKEKNSGVNSSLISARFHKALVLSTVDMVKKISEKTGLKKVVLSGGCFQNRLLLQGILSELEKNGFEPFTNEKTSANDGGISLGQVWVAAHILGG